MLPLLNYQVMKSCKRRESFCLSILFTKMLGPLFDMFTSVMFIFFSVKLLIMCKPRTGWTTLIGILWKSSSKPIELAGDGECKMTWFHPIKFSFKWNLPFFKAVPPNMLSFNLGSPLHIISSLLSHFCLSDNVILS